MAQHQGSGFQRRERLGPRFAAQPAESRRVGRVQHEPLQLQQPWVAPPQRLRLAPGAVEQHDALEAAQHPVGVGQRIAVAVQRDDRAAVRAASGAPASAATPDGRAEPR